MLYIAEVDEGMHLVAQAVECVPIQGHSHTVRHAGGVRNGTKEVSADRSLDSVMITTSRMTVWASNRIIPSLPLTDIQDGLVRAHHVLPPRRDC